MSKVLGNMHTLRKKSNTANKNHIGKQQLLSISSVNEKYFEIFLITVLLAFGIYHSILYFAHQVVPCSDFPGFVRVGRQLLSFQLPSSYKRAPVVGLLQATLSPMVGGRYPDLEHFRRQQNRAGET